MVANVPQMAATLLGAVIILAVDYRIMIAATVLAVFAAAAVCLPRNRTTTTAPPQVSTVD
jgi:hypothetical protein